jgi:phospholipase C
MTDPRFTRRQVLAGGIGGAAALGLASLGGAPGSGAETVRRAASVKAAGSDLSAIKHVVFLMHENRSFDHYFGTMGGVRGYDDATNRGAFTQAWPGGSQSTLLPFHMNTKKQLSECTNDLDHTWPAEHASWNGGAMDRFVSTHTSSRYEGALGINTMGYYTKSDLPFYYDLVKKFTVCDNYFCSVLGPTHPNRLMAMTGSIDPAGVAGGPILVTNSAQTPFQWTCTWPTMPEVLQDNNVSWKVYNPYGPNYAPDASYFFSKNMLLYFEQYKDPTSPLHQNAFNYYGPNVVGGLTGGVGPNHFAADVANNTLPQVSWILPPQEYDEHPPSPPALGEWYSQQVLNTLLSNPEVWASTVLFIMYDENDGFFDHVPPPSPPPGTPGEYLTVSPLPSTAGGDAGPIGLGVRVPMMVVSPFATGGHVCSTAFDHTSQLRFLETLFGVTAPNISSWRRSVTGDLTSAFRAGPPVTKAPKLPLTSDSTTTGPVGPLFTPTSGQPIPDGACTSLELIGASQATAPFAVAKHQKIPTQARATLTPI